MIQLHPHTRRTDSRWWQLAAGILIIVGAYLVLHSFEFLCNAIYRQNEPKIVPTVMASPVMDNHIREVTMEQVSQIKDELNFLITDRKNHMTVEKFIKTREQAHRLIMPTTVINLHKDKPQ